MAQIRGEPYRIELASSDLTTATPILLFDSEGVEHTVGPHESLILYSINVHMGSQTDNVVLFDDINDSGVVDVGERLLHVGTDATGSRPSNHDVQFDGVGKFCSTGRVPKVIADSAGDVVVTGIAAIIGSTSPGQHPDWKADNFGQD